MGFLDRLSPRRRVMLRVTSTGEPAAFDGLILFDGLRRQPISQLLTGEHTPFMLELPDRDVTVVVQARDRTRRVVVEYERKVNGRLVQQGRSWHITPVLRRRGNSIVCAGLPDPSEPEADSAPVVAPAI